MVAVLAGNKSLAGLDTGKKQIPGEIPVGAGGRRGYSVYTKDMGPHSRLERRRGALGWHGWFLWR